MKLTDGEILLKEWATYSYGRGSKKTDCKLILTNKRVIITQKNRYSILQRETSISAIKRWTLIHSQASGKGWIIFGIFLCLTFFLAIFGIISIVYGIRLNRRSIFALQLQTKRKSSNSLSCGNTIKQKNKAITVYLLIFFVSLLIILIGSLIVESSSRSAISSPSGSNAATYIMIFLLLFICSIFLTLSIRSNLRNKNQKNGLQTNLRKIRIYESTVLEIVEEFGANIVENR